MNDDSDGIPSSSRLFLVGAGVVMLSQEFPVPSISAISTQDVYA